jgi:hypothetical protein
MNRQLLNIQSKKMTLLLQWSKRKSQIQKKKEEPKAEEVKKEEVPVATTATNPPTETQPSAPT